MKIQEFTELSLIIERVVGREIFMSRNCPCPKCGTLVKDTDIEASSLWVYKDIMSILKKSVKE